MGRSALFFPQLSGVPRMVAVRQITIDEVSVDTPDSKTYQLQVAATELRVLAIVDGDIVTGGLTDGAEVIQSEVLPERLTVPADGAYTKYAESEEEPSHFIWVSRAHLNIRRHIILFELYASILLRRYDLETLKPSYVTVTLDWNRYKEPFSIKPVFSC